LRALSAAEEVIKGKGKRGQKRKSAALETGEPEPEPEVARAAKEVINGRGKGVQKRKSAALEAEPEPRARNGADDRNARPMEGTSGADDISASYR
jgi:hypothetical protein